MTGMHGRRPTLTRGIALVLAAALGQAIAALGADEGTPSKGLPVAAVVKVRGEPTATWGTEAPRPLAPLSAVFREDRVQTGKASLLRLRFNDRTEVDLAPEAELSIAHFVYGPKPDPSHRATIGLSRGFCRVRSGRLADGTPDRFKVTTEIAAVDIRGCLLALRLEPNLLTMYLLEIEAPGTIVITPTGKDAASFSTPGVVVTVSRDGEVKTREATEADAKFVKAAFEAAVPPAKPAPPPAPQPDASQAGQPKAETGEAPSEAASVFGSDDFVFIPLVSDWPPAVFPIELIPFDLVWDREIDIPREIVEGLPPPIERVVPPPPRAIPSIPRPVPSIPRPVGPPVPPEESPSGF